MVVGAGTVQRPADIVQACAVGARFLVSPGMTPELAAAALATELPYIPGVAFCPTGGIDEHIAGEYLALPNVPTVGGSWMAPPDVVAAGDWARVRRLAERASAMGWRQAA
jgi:2-dehydro-3-deoxyphosphogluconate aldolase / (4S)-4-hydroxy-2-oxoglutarate aldolase